MLYSRWSSEKQLTDWQIQTAEVFSFQKNISDSVLETASICLYFYSTKSSFILLNIKSSKKKLNDISTSTV